MNTNRLPVELVRDRILRGFRVIGRGRTLRRPYQARLSSAGKCVRALSYHRQGVPETDPMPAIVGLRFEVGDALHGYLDAKLRTLGLPVEYRERCIEIRTHTGLVITGHFDRSIGGTTVLDYKSASDASFRMMVRQNAPLADHLSQVNGYVHACQLTPDLSQYTHGLIVAFNKDTQDLWVSPPIEHNPDLAQATITKFEEVERHALAGTLPERPYSAPTDYPCRACQWRRQCWGEMLSVDQVEPAADLGALQDRARAYLELGEQIKGLERERDRAGGALRAALADTATRRGVAGIYEVTLATYTRASLNPDLLPSDIRAQATVETPVTQLRVAERRPEAAQILLDRVVRKQATGDG